MKRHVKKMFSELLGRIGNTGVLDRFEAPLLRMTKVLLAPNAVPSAVSMRRIRGSSLSAPCNPHMPFHRSMYWFGLLHERGLDTLLRRVLRPGDTLIDVGANFGQVSMVGAALVGSTGRVHAFEPHPMLSAQLIDHVKSQGCTQVTVHPIGLGASDGEFTLHVNPGHLGASTIREGIDSGKFSIQYQIRVSRGDDVLGGETLHGRIFLKIDVEGNEPAVIEGMADFIRERVAVMSIEVTPEWHGGSEGIKALFERVSGMGLKPYLLSDHAPPNPAVDPSSIREQVNVAFIRPGILDPIGSGT
jgi:FkbM family methyltransferase